MLVDECDFSIHSEIYFYSVQIKKVENLIGSAINYFPIGASHPYILILNHQSRKENLVDPL